MIIRWCYSVVATAAIESYRREGIKGGKKNERLYHNAQVPNRMNHRKEEKIAILHIYI